MPDLQAKVHYPCALSVTYPLIETFHTAHGTNHDPIVRSSLPRGDPEGGGEMAEVLVSDPLIAAPSVLTKPN